MSHLKGFQKPVIATPAALWVLKGLLILVSLVLVIRACTAKKSVEEWFVQKTTAISSGPSSTRDEGKINASLVPNEWSESFRPNPGQDSSYVWNTPDGLLDIEYQFDDGQKRIYNFDIREKATLAEFPEGIPFEFRFKHEKGGTVTITFR